MKNKKLNENIDYTNQLIKADKTINIFPAFDKDNVAVCFVSDDKFVPVLGVSLNSIIQNAKEDSNYDIIVLTKDITRPNIDLLTEMVSKRSNFSLRFFDISELVEGYKFYVRTRFMEYTYYRLLIPTLLTEYEKIIYLDCDVVVNCDISELFNKNVTGFYLAAALDVNVLIWQSLRYIQFDYEYYEKVLGLTQPGRYFQAGVLLLNLGLMRQGRLHEDLLYHALNMHYKWMDQDILNICCKDKVKLIGFEWNCTPSLDGMTNYYSDGLGSQYSGYISAKENPKIIHYAAGTLPCFSLHEDMAECFWEYAKNTQFYEPLLLSRENENLRWQKTRNSFKYKLKIKLIHPVFNLLFPKSSMRRKKLRDWYTNRNNT